jgi:hypothetical protein
MMFRGIQVALPALLVVAATALAAEPAAEPAKTSSDAMPAVDTSATPPAPADSKPAAAERKPATPGKRAQNDRLDLDTTIVTGNRELPAQPFNTLLDEVLTPVDRDVFRREVTYYGVVSSAGNAPPAAPASPGADPAAPARGDEK